MPSALRAREARVTIDAAELGKILEGIELSPTKQRVRSLMQQEAPAHAEGLSIRDQID
jgi:hypothetical protein